MSSCDEDCIVCLWCREYMMRTDLQRKNQNSLEQNKIVIIINESCVHMCSICYWWNCTLPHYITFGLIATGSAESNDLKSIHLHTTQNMWTTTLYITTEENKLLYRADLLIQNLKLKLHEKILSLNAKGFFFIMQSYPCS